VAREQQTTVTTFRTDPVTSATLMRMAKATESKPIPLSLNQILNAIVRTALRDPRFLARCLSEEIARTAINRRVR
jgi:hypothetical protein